MAHRDTEFSDRTAMIATIAGGFDQVLAPELNRGQLATRLRAEYMIDVETLSLMQGRPFTHEELTQAIDTVVNR